jgi:diguanylate cyclase (GGDEF)-like protein
MSDIQPVKILLIEDDSDDYVITRDLLSEIEGVEYHLDWTPNYEEGLRQIQANRHDLYMIDYLLGPDDGLQLLRESARLEMQAPIIILTGLTNREADVAAMQAGAMDYLIKGRFDGQLLERSIRYAIERHRLLKEIREMAIRDALTGLYNRLQLFRLLDYELERSKRYGHSLVLVWMDVDHFKGINDQYGHLFGDEMLCAVAGAVRSCSRASDSLFRYGGDEFAIVMIETSAEVAWQGAERLRKTVASQTIPFDHGDGKTPEPIRMTTLSIGIAEYPLHANSRDALIAAADQALYQAKRLGRNCIAQFHEDFVEEKENR